MFSHNEDELMAWGEKLGALLQKQDVLILTGDLGAGKTTFTKGLARGLGIKQMIKSPTYTIVREYDGRLPLYHLDYLHHCCYQLVKRLCAQNPQRPDQKFNL